MLAGARILATPATGFVNEQTTLGTISSTTPINGSPVAGVVFTGPPSGEVLISFSTDMAPTAGNAILVGVRVRTGSSIGSGTLIDGGEPGDGVNAQFARVLIFNERISAGKTFRVSGLTPGTTYNACTYYYVTGGAAGTIIQRGVVVLPIL